MIRKNRNGDILNVKKILQMYKDGFSCSDVGKKFTCSRKTVENILKDNNIKRRTYNKPSEKTRKKMKKNNKGINNPMYGRRREKSTNWKGGTTELN